MNQLLETLSWPPIVTLLAGAWAAITGLVRRDEFERALSWPTTSGVISEAKVEDFLDVDRKGGLQFEVQRMYRAVVAYDYRVGDKEYRGRRFGYAESAFSWRSGAEMLLRRHPRGQTVTVHVNPDSPADAIVNPTAGRRWADVLIAVGAALLAGGIWWLLGTERP